MSLWRELGFRIRGVEEQLRGLHAYDPRRRRIMLPGPFSVQIQTVDRCNASCRMCPYSLVERPGPPIRMKDELFEKILTELRATRVVRLFALMLQNEPMVDRKLAPRVRRAREVLGERCHLAIVTNGSMLARKRLEELLEAGIDSVEVSIDAHRRETFEAIRPGISFDRVVENTERLLEYDRALRIVVRFLVQQENQGEASDFRRHWTSRGAFVRFLPIVNRAGSLDEYEVLRSAPGLLRRWKGSAWRPFLRCATRGEKPTPCTLPFTWLNVLCDGRVILCCNDWGAADTVGDLSSESLANVWNSERMNHHRHLLWSGRFSESGVCRDCSIAQRP
jgi:MoaA/NifB/PqqE/SkfB family radical SAM enzyme